MVAITLPVTRPGHIIWVWRPLGINLALREEGLVLFGTVLANAWL